MREILLRLLVLVIGVCVSSERAMIVYISRGLLSSLSEARDVLDAISVENALTSHRVVINTYAVIDGELYKSLATSERHLTNIVCCEFSAVL